MSLDLLAWLMATPIFAVALYMFVALPLSRYRVVWVRFSIARTAFTRSGAQRLAEQQRRKHDDEFRVRDVWRSRWVDGDMPTGVTRRVTREQRL